MRTTVRLPDSLLAIARKKAREDGTTLTALIEEGLRALVQTPKPPPKRKKTHLPICRAGGGVYPGIDLVKTSLLEEIDDLERYGQPER